MSNAEEMLRSRYDGWTNGLGTKISASNVAAIAMELVFFILELADRVTELERFAQDRSRR